MLSLYTNLPPMEFHFTLDIIGNRTQIRYTGSFTYVRPTMAIRSEINKTNARLAGDVAEALDSDSKGLHSTLSWLKHTLTSFPKWWEESNYGLEIYDDNVLNELLEKTIEFEKNWSENVKIAATNKTNPV